MVPLIATKAEFDIVKARIDAMAQAVTKETGAKLNYQVGTMIELPRAALMAGEIAQSAEFFSFGTNDLTQTTFGISRDDAASLPRHLHRARHPAGRSVRVDRPRGRRRAGADRRRARPQGAQEASRSASAASTAATRPRSRSATRSGSTTCRARRSACRSRGSPRRRPRSARRPRARREDHEAKRVARAAGAIKSRFAKVQRRQAALSRPQVEGAPVILLHGYAQTSHMWRPLIAELAKTRTVIAPDLRGFGQSAKPPGGYDKKTMAQDVHALAVSLGIKRAAHLRPRHRADGGLRLRRAISRRGRAHRADGRVPAGRRRLANGLAAARPVAFPFLRRGAAETR